MNQWLVGYLHFLAHAFRVTWPHNTHTQTCTTSIRGDLGIRNTTQNRSARHRPSEVRRKFIMICFPPYDINAHTVPGCTYYFPAADRHHTVNEPISTHTAIHFLSPQIVEVLALFLYALVILSIAGVSCSLGWCVVGFSVFLTWKFNFSPRFEEKHHCLLSKFSFVYLFSFYSRGFSLNPYAPTQLTNENSSPWLTISFDSWDLFTF